MKREIVASVTNFLYCGDDYLFLHRNPDAVINADELNGIGGKVESKEDYFSTAIRETEEETGYKVAPKDIRFCGIIIFEGGYAKDWITVFFKIKVPSKKIPLGSKIREGELLWLNKNKVIGNKKYKLVDDVNYIFQDIVSEKNQFFMNVEVGGKDLKIIRKTTNLIRTKPGFSPEFTP